MINTYTQNKNEKGEWSLMDQKVGLSPSESLNSKVYYPSIGKAGLMSTPYIGPVKNWKSVHWKGTSAEKNSKDTVVYRHSLSRRFG